MLKRYNQSCPVAKTLEVIGDRWTLLAVRDLLSGEQLGPAQEFTLPFREHEARLFAIEQNE